MISAEQKSSKCWELTGEGCEIAEHGSHEARVFNAIPDEGLPQNQLMVRDERIAYSLYYRRKHVFVFIIQLTKAKKETSNTSLLYSFSILSVFFLFII